MTRTSWWWVGRFLMVIALSAAPKLGHIQPVHAQQGIPVGGGEPVLEPCEIARPGGATLSPPILCGWLPVPENRDNPQGRWISLKVVVVKSASDDVEPDAVVQIFGGPGEPTAGYAFLLGEAHREDFPRRDLVLVDQRGTGESNGLLCPHDFRNDRSVEEILAHVSDADYMATCRSALTERADLTQYHSTVAAHDLAAVIEWLGYEKVNLFGRSYGTRMVQVLLREYPQLVRTATMDALVTMKAATPGSYSADATAAFFRLLDRCERDSVCSAEYPGIKREAEAVLKRVERESIQATVTDPRDSSQVSVEVSKLVVGYAVRGMLYTPRQYPQLLRLVHTAYVDGDYSGFAQRFLERMLAFSGGAIAHGMYYSVFCTEDVPLVGEDHVARSLETLMDDMLIREYRATCEDWPVGHLPEGFHDPVRASVPALLISGEFDPVCTAANGETVATALQGAVHLFVPGGGHGWQRHTNASRCVQDIYVEFVQSGSLEGIDMTCVDSAQPPPFVFQDSMDGR